MLKTATVIERGVVKKFMTDKSFGFIIPDGSGPELFVHIADVQGDVDALYTGDKVEFERTQTQKGDRAKNVRLV